MPNPARILFYIVAFLAIVPMTLRAQSFRYWDPSDTTQPSPPLLSSTGLYIDLDRKSMIPEVVRYDVNVPVWTDGAAKLRWVLLKPGTSVLYNDTSDYWGYPDSAVFVQQFTLDTIPGDSASRILWETRLLYNKKKPVGGASPRLTDRWYGFTYKWKRDGSDAVLVDYDGEFDSLPVYPGGSLKPAIMKKWRRPGGRECGRCHVFQSDPAGDLQGRSVSGFFTAQLNRPYWHASAGQSPGNQLDSLFARGVLRGAPADWSHSPRWFASDAPMSSDLRDSLGNRARAYIAANCSHCHGRRGIPFGAAGQVSYAFDFHNPQASLLDFRGKPVIRSTIIPRYWPELAQLADSVKLVVAKHPELSLLLARQRIRRIAGPCSDECFSSDPMPPGWTSETDSVAVQLQWQWISEMGSIAGRVRTPQSPPRDGPVIRNRILMVPPALSGAEKIVMLSAQGRSLALRKTARGEWTIPAGMASSPYMFRIGNRSFMRFLF